MPGKRPEIRRVTRARRDARELLRPSATRSHQRPTTPRARRIRRLASDRRRTAASFPACALHAHVFAERARTTALQVLSSSTTFLIRCVPACRRPASGLPPSRLGCPARVSLAGRGRGVQREAVDPPSSKAQAWSQHGRRRGGGLFGSQDEQPEPNTKKRTPRNEQSRGWKRTVHESVTAGLGADPPAQAAAGRIARRSRRDCDGPPPRGLFDPRGGRLILRGARGLTSGCGRCRRSGGPCR
jgi:hypothetical protein